MSTPSPGKRRPVGATALPRRVLLSFALGAGLLVAALLLVLLSALGVDRVDWLGWAAVIVLAAVAGGLLARVVVPRLPMRERGAPPG